MASGGKIENWSPNPDMARAKDSVKLWENDELPIYVEVKEYDEGQYDTSVFNAGTDMSMFSLYDGGNKEDAKDSAKEWMRDNAFPEDVIDAQTFKVVYTNHIDEDGVRAKDNDERHHENYRAYSIDQVMIQVLEEASNEGFDDIVEVGDAGDSYARLNTFDAPTYEERMGKTDLMGGGGGSSGTWRYWTIERDNSVSPSPEAKDLTKRENLRKRWEIQELTTE